MNSNSKRLYPPAFLIRVFIYNTLIALALSAVNWLILEDLSFPIFIANLLFSHCIGWTLAFPLQWISQNRERLTLWQRVPMIFTILLCCGTAGAMLAYYLNYHLLFPYLPHWSPLEAIKHNIVLSFFFGLLAFFYFSVRAGWERSAADLRRKEVEQARLLELQKATELETLRAKIDPHFLFNTFNSIASLIRSNPDLAEQMLLKLSALFRFTLRSAERETVSLEEELQIIRSYLEIEQLRFGKRLRFDISCATELMQAKIPPLLLQPLVENSIKHGISKLKKDGRIDVTASRQGEQLQITVCDNGPGGDPDAAGGGFGLRSVCERLQLMYGKDHQCQVDGGKGFEVRLSMPLVTGEAYAIPHVAG